MSSRQPSRTGVTRPGRCTVVTLAAGLVVGGAAAPAMGQESSVPAIPAPAIPAPAVAGQASLPPSPSLPRGAAMLAGTVHALDTGLPVAGVHVEAVGTGLETRTGDDGRFRLAGLLAGAQTVRLRHLGFRPIEMVAEAVAGGGSELAISLERAPTPLARMVVTPGHYGMLQSGPASARTLTREQLRAAPQVGEDLFRVVGRLPGISASDFSAAFRVRGAAPEELLVTLDGVRLHEPFHLKDFDGVLSIVDLGAVGGLELNTGGFGARYPSGLSGVMEVHSVEPEPGPATTEVALTLTTLRGTSRGRFADGRGGWLVSARRGFLEYALRLAGEGRDVHPRYHDLLAKLTFQPAPDHDLALHTLLADDRLHYVDPAEPALVSGYGSRYLWGSWRARVGDGLEARTVASLAHLSWARDGKRMSVLDSIVDLTVRDRRTLTTLALRQDWTLEQSARAVLSWGVSAERMAAGHDYARGRLQVSERGDDLLTWRDSTHVDVAPEGTTIGAYLTQRLRPLDALTLELGVRADRYTARHARSYTLEHLVSPRLSAAWSLGDGATVRAAWGRYAQAQGAHELQASDGLVDLSLPDMAEHRVLGVEQHFDDGTTARVEAYDRRHSRVRPRYMGVDNTLELFPETGPGRQLVDATSARARGVELLLAHDAGSAVSWSASYALARAYDMVGGQRIARPLDQRHTIAADLSYRPSDDWRVSIAAVHHSGWPTTGFRVVRDTLADQVVRTTRDFGPRNGDRLGPYYRLDARVTRHFDIGGGRLSAFIDVFNVLDRRNPRIADPSLLPAFGRHFDTLLPRVPSFGASWEF